MSTPTNDATTPPNPATAEVDEYLAAEGIDANGDPVEQTNDGQDGDDEGAGRGRNAEAAARRRQLRETEAERDALRDRVAGFQRAEVERLAAQGLAVGADLFDLGRVELADLLDDDNNVDPEAVEAAVGELVANRPLLRAAPRPGGGVPRHGLGRRADGPPERTSWAKALRNNG